MKVMTLYRPDGTSHLVEYDIQHLSFLYGGISIQNPFMSECSRFEVDPRTYGFVEHHTGGGCTALIREMPVEEGGGYLLLTDAEGINVPDDEETALLGRYTNEGDPVALITIKDVPFEE